MCQYSAKLGMVSDYHLVHLGRFAIGGFGLVFVEATGVTAGGRISYACPGIWSDAHIPGVKRIADFLKAHGAAAGIQLAHSGRKGSTPNPWAPELSDKEKARVSYEEWTPVAPSAVPHGEGFQVPHELTHAEIDDLVRAFADAAIRADMAGFDVIEIHAAHGYLLDQFLSPLANKRTDDYGGSRENRMRFPLRVVEAVRAVWPDHKPLFMRFSVQDWHPDGWQIEDSVVLAQKVKALGVDVIDCSSGGFAGAQVKPGPKYQVPFSEAVRAGADISTMAVGLLGNPHDAEATLAAKQADLIALARPALANPNWPADALHALDPEADRYDLYAQPSGYAVRGMDRVLGN